MDNLVSVIIPCYNSEKYIHSSICSVYEQDYQNIELIIVDDGSTDNSKEAILSWVDRFQEKGYTLKYLYQENRGSGGAIDTGLKYVTGDYLTLLDADDLYLPESISKRADFLINHPDYAGVRSNGWMVKDDQRQLFITEKEEKLTKDLFFALIAGKTNNWAGTYMVRTDILFEFYPDRNIFPSRFGQNLQILLPVSYKRKFGYIDEPLMEYMIQPNSLSQSVENRYDKDEQNAQGYKEIRIQMLNSIVHDPDEHLYYSKAIDAYFARGALQRAIRHGRSDIIKKYYRELNSTGLATLNDHIAYYSAIHSLVVIPLKILRRLKLWINVDKM